MIGTLLRPSCLRKGWAPCSFLYDYPALRHISRMGPGRFSGRFGSWFRGIVRKWPLLRVHRSAWRRLSRSKNNLDLLIRELAFRPKHRKQQIGVLYDFDFVQYPDSIFENGPISALASRMRLWGSRMRAKRMLSCGWGAGSCGLRLFCPTSAICPGSRKNLSETGARGVYCSNNLITCCDDEDK